MGGEGAERRTLWKPSLRKGRGGGQRGGGAATAGEGGTGLLWGMNFRFFPAVPASHANRRIIKWALPERERLQNQGESGG